MMMIITITIIIMILTELWLLLLPADVRVEEKKRGKVEKYQDLKREIERVWKLKIVKVVPLVIEVHGNPTKEFYKRIAKLRIT